MAIKIRSILKNWFQNGKKPSQEQFWDWMDSFWHKTEDKIPITNVENLATTLNSKANQVALDAETTARQDSDAGLQEQISNLQKITVIRGNVDTHADLLAIDTANMRDGDSYIVEADETRDNKTTIYAFDANNSAWIYTGEWAGGDFSEYQKTDGKGVASGYAPLDADNKVPAVHLPETPESMVFGRDSYDFESSSHHIEYGGRVAINREVNVWPYENIDIWSMSASKCEMRNKEVVLSASPDNNGYDRDASIIEVTKEKITMSRPKMEYDETGEVRKNTGLVITSGDIPSGVVHGIEITDSSVSAFVSDSSGFNKNGGIAINRNSYNTGMDPKEPTFSHGIEISDNQIDLFGARENNGFGFVSRGISIINTYLVGVEITINVPGVTPDSILYLDENNKVKSLTIDELKTMLGL